MKRCFRSSLATTLISTLALAAGLLVSGCGQGGRETNVSTGNRDQILHLGNHSEPNDLDPHLADSAQTFNIVMAFFEGLAQYDPQTAQPVPAVAERWESNPEATLWTFHLRANAVWSDGKPVTAHDFVFAYRRILSPTLAAEYASALYPIKNAQEYNSGKITDATQVGVRAADDRTLVIELNYPVPYLPTMVCHSGWYPLPKSVLEKHGPTDRRGNVWTRPGNLVGNGYMVLSEWKPNQYIAGTKSPTYWDRDNVKLAGVRFYPIDSEDAEERSFRSGQLHATSSLPISKIPVYRANPEGVFNPSPMLATYYLRFNYNKPPLNDVRVRRALSLAINRESMVRDVLTGGQPPAGNLTPPDTAGFNAKNGVSYDLETARKLLAEAGYPEGKGFPKLEYLYNTSEGHRIIAEALQQMWRKGLGIDITLVNQEAKVWSDTMKNGDYQIGRMAWVGDYFEPSTFLELMTSTSGNNQTNWKSEEYDRLYAQAIRTVDETQRYALYQRLEDIIATEAPIAPIYFYMRNNLVRPEVKGWYRNLLDYHPLKGVYLEAGK